MKKTRFVLVILIQLLILLSCVSIDPNLRSYNPKIHGSPAEEWLPHRDVVEWWYATGVLENQSGDLYGYQFTIFHSSRPGRSGYIIDIALSDYQTGLHLFEEQITFNPRKAFNTGNIIAFGENHITLSEDNITIRTDGKEIAYELILTMVKPPVWHGSDGIIIMGHHDRTEERSFYYSFTNLTTEGWISYENQKGVRTTEQVSGLSWVDRQWGQFKEGGWDWFSFRFFNGKELMLFSFPETDYREGTLILQDGSAIHISDFDYTVEKWVTFKGKKYGLGWQIYLPQEDISYRVVPLSESDFNPNKVNNYWEGVCLVYDESDKLIGYCITETTEAAYK